MGDLPPWAKRPAPDQDPPASKEDRPLVVDYLETLLNLQCEAQAADDQTLQRLDKLLETTRELPGRVTALQRQTAELLDRLPRDREDQADWDDLEDEEDWDRALREALPSLRRLGAMVLLSPLIWNGVSLSVYCLEWWTGSLSGAAHLFLTWLLTAAWGLLLLALDARRR